MRQLLSHMQAEQACIDKFVEVLENEDAAIMARRLGDLPPLTEAKNNLLAQIAEMEIVREANLMRLGFGSGLAGTRAAAAAIPELREATDRLLASSASAQKLNKKVAAKVFTHLEFTESALSYLKSNEGKPLYGPDGVRRQPAGASSLARG